MVNRFVRIVFLYIFLCIPFLQVNAEGDAHDFTTAFDVELSKKFFKRLDLSLDEAIYFLNNSTQISKITSDLDVSYAVVKKILKLGLSYRATARHDEENYFWNHRFSGYANAKKDFGRVTLSLRSKYQMTYRPEKEPNKEWKNYWRNRLALSVKLPKVPLYPSVYAEMFYQTNNYKGNVIDRMRYEVALKYELNKMHSFKLYFDYEDEMNVKKPVDTSRLGLSYSISL